MSKAAKKPNRAQPKKKPKSGGTAAQPATAMQQAALQQWQEEAAQEVVYFDFADVESFEVGEADERQLKLLMRDWRKGRATQTFWDLLSNAYVTIFSVLVIGAMFVGGVLRAQSSAAGCSSAGCVAAKTMVPWLLIGAISMLALALARLFGPVVASAAEGFWLLEAPISRAQILKSRLWRMLAWTFVGGLLFAGLIGLLVGLSTLDALLWGAATGLVAFAMTAMAAAAQGADRSLLPRIVQALVSVLTTAVLLVIIGVSVGWMELPADAAANRNAAWAVLAAGGVLGVIAALLARQRLNGIRRARLVSGGDLVSGMQGAAFALDFALMRDILVERKYLERGQVRATRGRGVGPQALVWRDVQRLLRNPLNLLILIFSAIVPYALQALGIGRIGAPVAALILLFVLVPFFDSLRVISRTKGLSRCFPFEQQQLRSALMTVPGVLILVWALATIPAFMIGKAQDPTELSDAVWLSLITATAGYLGAIRWVSAKSADYSGPMVATGAGAMPPGLIFNLFRGFDVVAVIMLPVVFGWSFWISVILAGIVFVILRTGGMDMQEMVERQEEAKRELEAARAQSRGGVTDRKQIERSKSARSGKSGSSAYVRR